MKKAILNNDKIILSDASIREAKEKRDDRKKALKGKNWNKDLNPKQKDELLRLVCQKAGLIDDSGTVL